MDRCLLGKESIREVGKEGTERMGKENRAATPVPAKMWPWTSQVVGSFEVPRTKPGLQGPRSYLQRGWASETNRDEQNPIVITSSMVFKFNEC